SYEGGRSWRPSRFLAELELAGARHFSRIEIPALGGPDGRSAAGGLGRGASATPAPPTLTSDRALAAPRLSFSAISAYRECPRRYQYRYVHQLPVPTTAEASYG